MPYKSTRGFRFYDHTVNAQINTCKQLQLIYIKSDTFVNLKAQTGVRRERKVCPNHTDYAAVLSTLGTVPYWNQLQQHRMH